LQRSPYKVVKDTESRAQFLALYETRSKEGTAIKWLKFHTSYAFAYSLCQTELPVAPGPLASGELPGEFCGGRVGHVIHKVLRRARLGNWPCRRVAYDILMSKIGDPVAPQSFVDSSLKDHKAALTRKEVHASEMDPRERYVLSKVKDEIRAICREIYGGRFFHHCDCIPSLRASFENGMGNAGALGKLFSGFLTYDDIHHDQLFGMVDNPKDGVSEVRFIDGTDEVEAFQAYVDSLWIQNLAHPLDASPVGILEPLKVRIITKGGAAEYYRAIELQKFMHSNLKRHPVFQYIGHPIDDQSWVQAFGLRKELKEDEFYVSGDYKAATDNLRRDLSLFCWQMIAESGLISWHGRVELLSNTPYYLLGRKCLGFHRLHYGKGRNEEVVDQSWGQLMGSPMSFPILCIVNAAASLVSLGQHLAPGTRMRVNGDDIGFIANEESYATWKYVTKVCGLEFSLGKNYTSRDFLIMNSELRRPPKEASNDMIVTEVLVDRTFDPETAEWTEHHTRKLVRRPWKLEGFLNQSILYGTVKKGLDAGQKKVIHWTDLESLSHEALRGIPSGQQEKVLKTFLMAQLKVVKSLPTGCNLYIPKSLGGAGCAIPQGCTLCEMLEKHSSPEEAERSLKIAAYLACNNRARLGPNRPTVSKPLFGEVKSAFKEILSVSDRQVPRMLRPKPLRREQHVMLGGTTFLGYLLRALGGRQVYGGQEPESSMGQNDAWERESFQLRRQYKRWTGDALHCSLTPMSIEKVSGYQEHLELRSYIEFLSEKPNQRGIDSSL